MSDTHEAMKRRYAVLMMAELAWLDDLASEDATARNTRVTDGQVTIHIRKPRGRRGEDLAIHCAAVPHDGPRSQLVRAVGLAPFPPGHCLSWAAPIPCCFHLSRWSALHSTFWKTSRSLEGLIVRNIVRNATDVYRLG